MTTRIVAACGLLLACGGCVSEKVPQRPPHTVYVAPPSAETDAELARLRLRIDGLTDRVNDIYTRQIQLEDYLQRQAGQAEENPAP
jgi:hypothetical protein